MWNSKTYRDMDFGLQPDEEYEPSEDVSESFSPVPGEAYIQTVLGPIRPTEAGLALVGEHLHADASPTSDAETRVVDREAALRDLETLFSVGGTTIVDATPQSDGRNAKVLQWLAQRAPVHIIGTAGFGSHAWLSRAYPNRSLEKMRSVMQEDISSGMEGTNALPGVLSVAAESRALTSLESIAFELVAEAHGTSDLSVKIMCAVRDSLTGHVSRLHDLGVPHDHIVATHLDADSELRTLRELADHGVFLAFDRLGWHGPVADLTTAAMIARLADEGYLGQLLLSHGFNKRSQLTGYNGGPGLGYIVEQFAIMLMESGIQASDVRTILVDNAARALSTAIP